MSKTLIVIPAYNEAEKIVTVIQEIKKIAGCDILVVDDGSTDSTKGLAESEVRTLSHIVNMGKGAALKTGFNYALEKRYDHVITCDADGQHLVEDVQQVQSALLDYPNRVVLGSRFLKNNKGAIPKSRYLYNRIANWIIHLIIGIKVSDSQCGLRGYPIEFIQKTNLVSRGLDVDSEILGQIKKLKIDYAEIPIIPVYTDYSLSKGQNLLQGVRTLYGLLFTKF